MFCINYLRNMPSDNSNKGSIFIVPILSIKILLLNCAIKLFFHRLTIVDKSV